MSTGKLNYLNNFSERLKELRGTRKKAEFARLIGVSPPLYHQWENGQIPTGDKALLIAKACNVPIDWLLTGKSVMQVREYSETGYSKDIGKTKIICHTCDEKQRMIDLQFKELTSLREQLARANAVIDTFTKGKNHE